MLATCTPFQTFVQHPLFKDFTIKMQIYGIIDGKCKFTQTMPNNGLQTCFFTEQQRNAIKTDRFIAWHSISTNPNTCQITGY